jgi:two-component system, NarL family, nitrate/nitrite response regulator NarL
MEKLCILIIDDHALFRTGLSMILTQDDRIDRILEAGSVMEALGLAQEEIDLILLDIQMPGLNGLDGIKVLQDKLAGTPIIILSASGDSAEIEQAENLGAAGYLQKSARAEEITSAIQGVLKGESCFPKSFTASAGSMIKNEASSLTSRQLAVLTLLCEGKTNKIIAQHLDLAENTVRVHVSAILSCLGVASRSEAMLVAQRLGIVSTDK